jgi:hypothetical protein
MAFSSLRTEYQIDLGYTRDCGALIFSRKIYDTLANRIDASAQVEVRAVTLGVQCGEVLPDYYTIYVGQVELEGGFSTESS